MAKGLVRVSEYASGALGASVLDEARRRGYAERLEAGHILLLERTPFALPDAAERAALASVRQASSAYHKNISHRPGEDRVKGVAGSGGDTQVVHRALRTYSHHATRLLTELPSTRGQAEARLRELRPIEERGRQLSLRA
jgi:hypothetical protein